MLRLNQGFHAKIKHFWGLIWPLRGLAQKGEGTNVGAGFPLAVTKCVTSSPTYLITTYIAYLHTYDTCPLTWVINVSSVRWK